MSPSTPTPPASASSPATTAAASSRTSSTATPASRTTRPRFQFTPVYDTTPGTLTPNFKNILLQNLTFLTEGTVQFTGANNNGVINPLIATLDNVSFATLATSDFNAAPTNAQLTLGPGQVSSNFVTAYQTFVGANGNTLTDNRTATSLFPPACSFTFIAPELTGPAGLPQTITSGQTATAVVILTPAVGGSAYPTGTVTLTDSASTASTTVTLPGTGDTISIPLTNLAVGTHTLTRNLLRRLQLRPRCQRHAVLHYRRPTSSSSTPAASAPALPRSPACPATSPFGTPFTVTATVAGSSHHRHRAVRRQRRQLRLRRGRLRNRPGHPQPSPSAPTPSPPSIAATA